jgi:crossover junction endodeoxyribonuclease RuvC
MIILSIDPGVERLGIAILTKKDATIACKMSDTLTTPKTIAHSERIGFLYSSIKDICRTFRPDQIVLERLFFSKNVKTAISVAQVQGVIHLIGYENGIPVSEVTPNMIKSAVTGYGSADKKAVKKMIDLQIKLPPRRRLDDEYDAIACGFAYLLEQRN